jgi:bifunctional DNA-binding transcriptional regulator/antitoxin component of YhaV-PrlF toxin-antitoxin module
MVIIMEQTVFENKGVKRITIPKPVSTHLEIKKGDSLFLFVVGNMLCYSTNKETVTKFLNRCADKLTDFFIV